MPEPGPPLTDRNLQTLLEQNDLAARYTPIALDMDNYTHDHDKRRHSTFDQENADFSLHSGDSHSMEFGQLNPSLDHSSDLTSLDDVCFPDYYEGSREQSRHEWPELSVLQDYILEEFDDLKDDMQDVPGGVNFHDPVARRVSTTDKMNRSTLGMIPVSQFDNILPHTEDTPLLNSVQVDETTSVRLSGLSLRVRPKPIQPWEKNSQQMATILNNLNNKKSDAVYRFTYFRENIDGTIHSPTLSGLISDNEPRDMKEEQIHEKLAHLFSPRDSAEDISIHTSDAPTGGSSQMDSDKDTRLPELTKLSELTKPTDKVLDGLVNGSHEHAHHAPFWLDVLDPSEEEMKVLSKTFGLHPLTTEDIFLGETREKVELFRQYYFICFTSFDIVYERRKQRAKENEKKMSKMLEYASEDEFSFTDIRQNGLWNFIKLAFQKKPPTVSQKSTSKVLSSSSNISRDKKIRSGELSPLNMYMIIFKHGVLTFHFNATPHPVNVRRRARMLKDHLTVSTDWICYALIDDITDSFAPMIDSIELEVYHIEDEIMRMHSGDSSESDLDDEDDEGTTGLGPAFPEQNDVFYRRQRSKSVVEIPSGLQFLRNRRKRGSHGDFISLGSAHTKSTKTTSTKSTLSKIVAWKRKGDMLRRIGECRKRVMSVMRLLGSKADVIKGFSKRFNENESSVLPKDHYKNRNHRLASRMEIVMYLGDIQDHIVTMVQSLNHYEKLLARSHSNYLAQLNIDMTKVNNDTNDILGKVTILGTIVLPINVVTGLWGMNCIVPGQDHEGLVWFYGILVAITMFSVSSYIYARKVTGL